MQKTTKTEECPKNNVDEREREKSGDSNIDQKEGEVGDTKVGGEDEAPPESDGAANSGWLYAASKSLSLHLMRTKVGITESVDSDSMSRLDSSCDSSRPKSAIYTWSRPT